MMSDDGEGGGGGGTTAASDSPVGGSIGSQSQHTGAPQATDGGGSGTTAASDSPVGGSVDPPLQQIGPLQETGGGTIRIMMEDTQVRAPMDTNLVDEKGGLRTMRNDCHLSRGPAVASDWPSIGDSTAPPLQQMHDVKACQLEIAQPRQPLEFVEVDENSDTMPSPHEMPMPSLATGSALVHDVWEETAPMAFAEISAMMKSEGEFLIGLDSEFDVRDGAVLPGREPPTADDHYQQLCTIVNGGNLVQLGLAIADARFHVLGIWQFNMKFSVKWRKPWHAGVVFLRDTAKLRLQEHEKRGVNPSEFIVWFTGSGMLKNVNITWITFNGYSDYGLLIRLMDGKDMLPPKRLQFLNVFWTIFPRTYDLRVFTKLGRCRKAVIDGGLAKVCEALGVRIVGETHHAGTDALSAIRCMERLISEDPEFSQRMVRYSGVLYGVVVDAW